MEMEGACELNGVLVRAVGSSGSMARRRLRDPPSLEREIVGQVAFATTSGKKENEDGEEETKNTFKLECTPREKPFLRPLDIAMFQQPRCKIPPDEVNDLRIDFKHG